MTTALASDALTLIDDYRAAYSDYAGKPAPEVRQSGTGGFYVKAPIRRHYTTKDFIAVTRFYQRGGE